MDEKETRIFMSFTYDVERFRGAFEHEMTWLNGFMRNVERYRNKIALRCGISGQTWTYGQLNQSANRLANAFLNNGLKKNDIVMYALFNSAEFIFLYLATHKTGSISCPVNYRSASGEIAAMLEDSRPKFFVYDTQFNATVKEALRLCGFQPGKVLFCGDNGLERDEDSLALFMRDASEREPVMEDAPHIYDETVRLYTSGTTSCPKGVQINSINEVFSAHDVIMHYPLGADDRTMNLTPWFHRGGLHIGGPTPTLYVGGEVVILKEFRARNSLELITSSGTTYITGVPSIFRLLARARQGSSLDLSALRGLCSMGSPFSKAELMEYREIFTPNILNGYGTTETCVNTFLRAGTPLEKCSATGQACIDDDVRIVRLEKNGHADPEKLVMKDNKEIGEIIIRASHKSTGSYVNNPEMSAKKFYKNYHYTGDLGTWDEEGYITVLCRKDDMIISAGENIYPAQIEAVLNEHIHVAESAVIGVPDMRHGQCVAAFVVASDASLTVEELKSWCARHPMLPAYKRPKIYKIVEVLPHTATGKIMHYRLRDNS